MVITTDSFFRKLLILVILIAGLYFAKAFLIPISIGTLLAMLFLPFCKWLEKKHVSRGLASAICLLALMLAVAGVTGLLGWQFFALTKDLDQIKQKLLEIIANIQGYIFSHAGISPEQQSKFIGNQQPFVTRMIQRAANSLTTISVQAVLVMVYVLFLLYYRSHFRNFLLQLVPPAKKEETDKIIYRVAQVSQQYLVGLSKMIVCLWIMYGVGFSLLGVKNALFFAFLCGLLEIVPFVGNITGTSITVLVSAAQGASPALLAGIVATYSSIQFIQGWVLEPLIVGPQVKINPLFTIIALVVGELVWGIPGIFLAIPVLAMFKIVCDHVESLKPLGFLIGETKAGRSEPWFIRQAKKWYSKKKWNKE
ncbi:MAG TPA: AI-2E family transporter [Bacteroidia bacterium]|nr:AI-2E family transporter [Bacteroidia bacterium]